MGCAKSWLKIIILEVVLCLGQYTFAQDPPDVIWQQIQTPHFDLIFPQEIEHDAQRVANTLEHIYQASVKNMEVNPKKIAIILHNQTTNSNGFVTLAPRRSEWESTPFFPGELDLMGTGEWYNLLAVHEFRHVVQFEKSNTGLTKIIGLIAGENAQLLMSILASPLWFWEGDAVGMETALTNTGRGRNPSFEMHIRGLLLEDKLYSYNKAVHRSYKDYYPSHYELGYLLTTFVKRKYGPSAWQEILERSNQLPFLPYSFNRAVRSKTGQGVNRLYHNAMRELDSLWTQQQAHISPTAFQAINRNQKKGWTNYRFPQMLPDGSTLVVKNGISAPRRLVKILPDGAEVTLGLIDFEAGYFGFSVSGNKATWHRTVPDKRWRAATSVVVVMDLKTKKQIELTQNTYYFLPKLSNDGKQVATIEFTPDRQCALVILDAENGGILRHIGTPKDAVITGFDWSDDDSRIVFTQNNLSGKGVFILTIETKEIETVLPYGAENISKIVWHENYLFYQSPVSGIDNVYALDLDSKERFQVVSAKLGAFNPSISGNTLYYNNYTTLGHDAVAHTLDSSEWKPFETVETHEVRYYEPLIEQEQGQNILDPAMIPKEVYPVTAYRSANKTPKVHSWSPNVVPPNYVLEIEAQNLLNTYSLSLQGGYNENTRGLLWSISGDYKRWYPMIRMKMGQAFRNGFGIKNGEIIDNTWKENSAGLMFVLPLNFSRGALSKGITFKAGVDWVNVEGQEVMPHLSNGNGNFIPVQYHLSLVRGEGGSYAAINPRKAQLLEFGYRHTPFGEKYKGTQLTANGTFYFPGLVPQNSIVLEGSFERNHVDTYAFSSNFKMPSGYHYVQHDWLSRLSAHYTFPIAYPEIGIPSTVYIPRLHGNFFLDYGVGKSKTLPREMYSSVGFDTIFDLNFFDLPVTVKAGIRSAWLLQHKEWKFLPLFDVGFE